MSESIIQVTSGGGPKIHTNQRTGVGGNTVEDQYVLPGEYGYASYIANGVAVAASTSSAHLLQLMAGGSLNVRIRRIRIDQAASVSGSAAAASISVYRLSSAGTGGSAITPAPFDTTDSASGATAMTLPSAKGTETTQLLQMTMVFRKAVLDTAAQMDDAWEWAQLPNQKPIIIPAGAANGIAVKMGTGQAALTLNVAIEFVETAY